MDARRTDTNNPNNPLSKVASLVIDRLDEKKTTNHGLEVPLKIGLTFNYRKDMVGTAQDSAGNPVTIAFAMGIRNASLELSVAFNDPAPIGAKIEFVKLAHIQSALNSTTTKSTESNQSKSGYKAAAKGKVKAEGSVDVQNLENTRGKVSLAGGLEGAALKERKASKKTTTSTEHKSQNVNGTTTGTRVQWSIQGVRGKPLIGEIFPQKGKAVGFSASVIRNKSAGRAPFEVHGTVRALMQDVIIEKVTFTNSSGMPIGPGKLEPEIASTISTAEVAVDLIWPGSALRGRVMREIIRKHLSAQGLSTSSANVEICKAHG